MDLWDILRSFGTFCISLVHFSGFGIVHKDKSGNPAQFLKAGGICRAGFALVFDEGILGFVVCKRTYACMGAYVWTNLFWIC
jgi:hypothetical protein